jgi:hypothetical protein
MPISCHRSSAAAVLELHTPDAAAAVRLLELATEHLKRAKPSKAAASVGGLFHFNTWLRRRLDRDQIRSSCRALHITVAYFQSAIGAVRV